MVTEGKKAKKVKRTKLKNIKSHNKLVNKGKKPNGMKPSQSPHWNWVYSRWHWICGIVLPSSRPSQGLNGEESTCQCRKCGVYPWVGNIPWRRKWQPTPGFLPWKIPWTEEPGGAIIHGASVRVGLSIRAGHDLATKQQRQPQVLRCMYLMHLNTISASECTNVFVIKSFVFLSRKKRKRGVR